MHRCVRLYKIKIWKTSKDDVDRSQKILYNVFVHSVNRFSNRLGTSSLKRTGKRMTSGKKEGGGWGKFIISKSLKRMTNF